MPVKNKKYKGFLVDSWNEPTDDVDEADSKKKAVAGGPDSDKLNETGEEIQDFNKLKEHDFYKTSLMLKTMYKALISRTYQFPLTVGGHVMVQELMLESCLTFHVPISFLILELCGRHLVESWIDFRWMKGKLCIDEESKKITALESLGELSERWDKIRQEQVALHNKYIERYQSNLNYLMLRYHAPYFKKSTDKTKEELTFAPTNMHLQRMAVKRLNTDEFEFQTQNAAPIYNSQGVKASSPQSTSLSPKMMSTESSKSESVYDVITVGVATAPSLEYKQGGLLMQLANKQHKGKRNKKLSYSHITQFLKRRASFAENDETPSTKISNLTDQVKNKAEKLKNLVSKNLVNSDTEIYSTDRMPALHDALSSLSQSVCELTTFSKSNLVVSSVDAFSEARQTSTPDLPVPKSPTSDVMVNEAESPTSLDSAFTETRSFTTYQWENTHFAFKSAFSDVAKSINSLFPQDIEEQCLKKHTVHAKAFDDLSTLKEIADRIGEDGLLALTFQELANEKQNEDSDITFRRNAVFSQALSTSVCGVSTLIASSIKDKLKLHQFSEVGIFFQVESLLSTYGSELGMLQDYTVAVMDLSKVTFKCVLASEQPSRMSLSNGNIMQENLLPTFYGSTNDLTIRLHFDKKTFGMLPSSLKEGKLIKIHPVIFNVGINEEQSLAERFGSTTLQGYLNIEAASRTLEYYDLIRDNCPNCIGERLQNADSFLSMSQKDKTLTYGRGSKKMRQFSLRHNQRRPSCVNINNEPRPMMELLNSLNKSVQSKKNKNVEIHQLAGDICRRLNGIRVTSCKSAKDRTAMALTLEQARILANDHGMDCKVFRKALDCMRRQGTRRENVIKNTGSQNYAFASVQLMTFPKLYRAPDGTYGKNER